PTISQILVVIRYELHKIQAFFLFFFSSRRRHTRFSRDWSSDVCSSDLSTPEFAGDLHRYSTMTGARLNYFIPFSFLYQEHRLSIMATRLVWGIMFISAIGLVYVRRCSGT